MEVLCLLWQHFILACLDALECGNEWRARVVLMHLVTQFLPRTTVASKQNTLAQRWVCHIKLT